MFIIGERINSTRKSIKKALAERDVGFLQAEATKQVEAGAAALDLNAAALVGEEQEVLPWLVDIVQEVASVPLCIDTPDATAARLGLEHVKARPVFINSISAEESRYGDFLALMKDFEASAVALAADDKHGMAKSGEDKLAVGKALVESLLAEGISADRIYVDALVFPLGTDHQSARALLYAIRGLNDAFEGIHTTVGLSNVSYGLPERKLLNRTLLTMAVALGLDCAILDPTDSVLMASLNAAEALAGRDDFCTNYIQAFRDGKLTPEK